MGRATSAEVRRAVKALTLGAALGLVIAVLARREKHPVSSHE
jgi:hypothetical protein